MATKTDKPNLFNFATSELSQDAVICWLLSWGEPKYRQTAPEELVALAKNCAAFFLNRHDKYKKTSVNEIESIINLEQQYGKIDVYFQVLLDNKNVVSVIIEDKTGTSHQSNQIERYLEHVKNDKKDEDDTIGIYFKTGLITDYDKDLPEPYRLVDLDAFLKFLNEQNTDHPIFKEYLEYINSKNDENEEILRKLEDPKKFLEVLENSFGQWAFLEKLFRNDRFRESNKRFHVYKPDGWLGRGNNIGGASWTQFWFFEMEAGQHIDGFFYRIDFKKEGKTWKPYLALRKYQKYDKSPKSNTETVKRLNYYRKIFDETIEELKDELRLVAGYRTGDFSGNFEQEIGIFFIDRKKNTVRDLIEELPKFHVKFAEKLSSLSENKVFYLRQIKEEVEKNFINIINPDHEENNKIAVTYYEPEEEGNLLEIKISRQHWIEAFGEEGIFFMIYQYNTTAGISLRLFLNSSLDQTIKDNLQQVFTDEGYNPNIRPVNDWNKWSMILDSKSYPPETCTWNFSNAAIQELFDKLYKGTPAIIDKAANMFNK